MTCPPPPNGKNDLPRVTQDTFLTSPMISVLFIPVGRFHNFEVAEPREKADLQAVALIYKYIGKGTNSVKFRTVPVNFGFSSQVRLDLS